MEVMQAGNKPSSEYWQYKKYSWLLCLPIVTVLFGVAALNLLVNPFKLYGDHSLGRAAQNLRIEKYELARQGDPKSSVLIIGSSRVMSFDPEVVERYLPGECFNYGMASAMAEDYYAALRLLREDAGFPVTDVVLGVDLKAFNPAVGTMSEGRYFPAFNRYLHRNPAASAPYGERLTRLISIEQGEESFNALLRARHDTEPPKIRLMPDGLAIQTLREQRIAEGLFNLDGVLDYRIRKYPERSLHLSGYTQCDPVRIAYLEDFLDYCNEHGITVHAFLTPFHPRLWDVLNIQPNAGVLDEARKKITAVFEEHGVPLRDFSHIESFDGDPQLFYDEIHLQPGNAGLILRELLTGHGGADDAV